MADYSGIDDIALTLIQSTGLLLPVVFLTFRFYLNDVGSSATERELERSAKKFVYMISALTITGFFGTISVFNFSFKPIVALISVSSLAAFFLLYGWFIYSIVT
ncbi:hypothetical protein [Salinigranum halophilum]|uniref:hypothetical protein n=1 Tax=Salinigranum halophilum TaxID=2565931 RepID=UPI0010A87CD7|nr:hypothetical protein [Salinigranum halophilum]